MFNRIIVLYLYCCLFLPLTVHANDLIQQGLTAFQQGNTSQAIESWKTVLLEENLSFSQQTEVSNHLAEAYQELGDYPSAYKILQQALSLAEQHQADRQTIVLYNSLGDVLLAMQEFEKADLSLQKGLDLARRANQPHLIASLLNSLGNSSAMQQDNSTALTHYEQAQKLATNDTDLSLKILINQTHIQLKQGDVSQAGSLLQTIVTEIKKPPQKSASQWLSVGQLALRLLSHPSEQSTELLIITYQVLEQALQLATRQKNHRLIASAKGYLGQVYEHAQRYPEALQLTQEAIFLSQENVDLLYRWEWQQGRILQKQGDLTTAIIVYQRALGHLKSIRAQLIKGYSEDSEFFNESIRPVYFGLVDILLQQAKTTTDSSQKTQLLRQARETAESLKIAELQDYFQSECLPERHSATKAIDTLDAHTAILYPILLADRIELLVSFADEIRQQIVPIELERLRETVMQFQKNLQARTHFRFMTQARQLYQWLISPLIDLLKQKGIDTLVIIPDGPLRMIPLAALFDDQRKEYLIEQFAVAVTPSLNLTEPQPLPRENITILLSGLSEGVQNFSPLPNVIGEMDLLKTLFSHKGVLLDKQFLMTTIHQTLKESPYSMVHIASHGQFSHNVKETFVLTYDGRLTMDQLQNLFSFTQFRQEHIELLTLSACQTAVGDERAALGLAGVAIKAGVRSALASLWSVNDESTALLMKEFYQQLQNPNLSRAKALQNTQKMLIKNRTFSHPLYWSPFLLIGNWL